MTSTNLPQQLSNSREYEDDFGVITNSMKAHTIVKGTDQETPNVPLDTHVAIVDDTAPASTPLTLRGKISKFIFEGTENAWIRLVIYCLACLLTSCIYFGWQDYSKMMIWGGAYDWHCDGQEPGSGLDDPDDPALCLDQSKKVSSLYSFANGSEFVCAAVAGVLLDSIGPRYTACLGELFQLLSILMLSFSSQRFQMYIPAIIVTGACVNIISFPALTVMEAWPKHQALAISIIVGAQSSASVISPIMARAWAANPQWTYRGLWLCFLVIFWLPITLAYIWALPRRRNYKSLLVVADGKTSPSNNIEEFSEAKAVADPDIEGASGANAEEGPTLDSNSMTLAPTTAKEGWKKFFGELRTLDMALMACFCAMLMFQFAYFPAVVRDAVGTSISDFVGWLTPLQGPFSCIIGFFMDYTGTVLIMYLMCATLVYVNFSCAYGSDLRPLMQSVGFVFVFVQSATYNVKYTFVNEMYDPFNFGKLVGFLGIAGGIGVYVSGPLTTSTAYRTVFGSLGGLGFGMALVTTWMLFRQFIQNKSHKTIQGVSQTRRLIKRKEKAPEPIAEAS